MSDSTSLSVNLSAEAADAPPEAAVRTRIAERSTVNFSRRCRRKSRKSCSGVAAVGSMRPCSPPAADASTLLPHLRRLRELQLSSTSKDAALSLAAKPT